MDKSIYLDPIKECIGFMRDSFDSHDLIHLFAHFHPELYLALVRNYGTIQQAHSQFAIFVSRNGKVLGVKKVRDGESANLYNEKSKCATWEKEEKQI